MVILFSPRRGERVTMGVPSHASTIELHFSATFASLEDERGARLDGVIIELWSDIPMAHGKAGQWGALGFEWPTDHTDDSGDGDRLGVISKCTSPTVTVLHLRTRIPISKRNQVQYTYRLIYPSGRIEWLGGYQRDGVLVFERQDPALTRGISFNSHAGQGTFFSGQDKRDNVEIMRLNQDTDWSIYAIREDGSVYNILSSASIKVLRVFYRSCCILSSRDHAFSSRVSLAIFVPVIRPESLVILPTFSLAVSRGSSISINALGSISITGTGKGSLFVQTYDAGTKLHLCKAAIHDSLSFSSFQNSYQLLPCDHNLSYTILASQAATCPQFVFVIPITALSSTVIVRLQVHTLCALLPSGTAELALFSCSSSRASFLKVPSDERSEEAVTLLVGPECSQFIVAPVYILRARGGVWGVSILTPHVLVAADPVPISHLPTPPPSPPFFQPSARNPHVSLARSKTKRSDPHSQKRITANAGPRLALTICALRDITRFFSYIVSLTIWLLKLWLLRMLLYYSARRLPYEGTDDWSEGEEALDESSTIWQGIESMAEEDEASVSRAAFVVELDEKEHEYSPLLLDVAGKDVSVLLRPAVGFSYADFIKIELDGQPIQPNVQALDDGFYLVGFRGRSSSGRVSIFA
ncbi:hypothetical protein PILCRDRAFT_5807 [Piloderma croceum F 1598]|uniref:Uncharacterized protein n=1 Tax=Piloderma croceum (strain F 1598) TaxID=765440 RepID=A0A0C3G080_PILCF|nr:hypothetical protein PILCRDRAFT_5807 [Piloderma croceum F 1598]